ncbi:hypothetical protein DMN91_003315 [Ooceraea biroi]|uniref:Uncharacterized protein n=1 Tax=Ooceraea biroi TaxID=2015173 RepID=A0A3L8DY55_OOCBI|nr:hypothetical protein DMN91_003315 [Ooceraea biroi]
MSPTIPILSALLLSLISGSTESGQRMDSVALLRQTLRYWLKIYKTYHEEVMLGYCWAGYLLEISDELSANLSATPLAVTGDRPNTSIGATKSQQNPFPQNVMVHATSHGGARTRKHLWRRRSYATSSTIWKFINSPDEHRDTSRSRIIRQRWTMNMAERGVSLNDRADESEESDGNESTQLIDSYHGKSRHASMSPEIHQDEGEASRGHGFSSRRTSWRAVNPPASNPPKDDDKVDSGLMVSGGGKQEDEKGDTRRKVLRSLTSHRDSPEAEGVLQLPSFSLKVSRGRRRRSLDGRRFPFRRRSPPRERNLRVDEPLSNPCRMPEVNRGMKDPERHRVPLSGDGGVPTPSRLQFRRTPDRQSPVQQPSFVSILRSIIIGAFRTLGMFVQVGRQVMDAVESNTALVCTKEYLWAKIVKWIDA